ncbi:MAG TPA: glycosyltransferase family 4 protein [Gammaproteobacteria bacterium]|nr:glycosyltransferase family 4 protein [Gammaproteobacteria bacterium]
MTKLIVVAHQSHTLVNLRFHLITDFLKAGLKVTALAPPDQYFENARQKLNSIGVELLPLAVRNTSLNVFNDIKLFSTLKRYFRELKPDLLFFYSIKPVIFGSLAAKFSTRARVNVMFPGLGYVFTGDSYKQRLLRFLIKPLYKWLLASVDNTFFHNADDAALFLQSGLVKQNQVVLTDGSGVDTHHFAPLPYPQQLSFLFVGRLIRDKGINEFIEAARCVKQQYPEVRFLIAGGLHNNPTGLTQSALDELIQSGVVEYLGELMDIREALKQASVFVLPSYREGLPRSALEAMATARPIITTDAPGCREVVRLQQNGFLAPVKDVEHLVEFMHYFIEHPEAIAQMGAVSREIAVQRFGVSRINRIMLEAMKIFPRIENEDMDAAKNITAHPL